MRWASSSGSSASGPVPGRGRKPASQSRLLPAAADLDDERGVVAALVVLLAVELAGLGRRVASPDGVFAGGRFLGRRPALLIRGHLRRLVVEEHGDLALRNRLTGRQ